MLLSLLTQKWFIGLALPVLVVVMTAAWEVLARPGRPSREDAALGLDLLVTAAGSQLTFLVGHVQNLPPGARDFAVGLGELLFMAILLAVIGTAVLMRIWGYEEDRRERLMRIEKSHTSGHYQVVW